MKMEKAIFILTFFSIYTLFGCQGADYKSYWQSAKTTEQVVVETKAPAKELDGKVIVIDAGHGINDSGEKEPVAPGSSQLKSGFVSGTQGANITEEELNLMVAKKLEAELVELGAKVHMTRVTHETDMSNIDRAKLGNEVGADLAIRLHADGNNNSQVRGISMLVPSARYVSEEVYQKSHRAGSIVLDEVILATGATNRGVVERSDMTGFNWSEVPVILLEMGFMSNPEDDALLETDEYQKKIIDGITAGVLRYFE